MEQVIKDPEKVNPSYRYILNDAIVSAIKFHPRESNREEIVINIEFPTADYQFQ